MISVIIPVFNREEFIAEAIQSVLNQDYNPIEVLVVDDGSTDRTRKTVEQFGKQVRYIFQENSGPANARNTGLNNAAGDFIGFLDADDLWPENRLGNDISILNKYPDLGFVIGCTKQVFNRGTKIRSNKKEETTVTLLMGCALLRSSVFKTVGNFDETMKFGEDLDWFLRAKESGIPFRIIEKISLIYRIHENNMSNDRKQLDHYTLLALKKSLDRKRKSGNITDETFLTDYRTSHLKSFLKLMNRP